MIRQLRALFNILGDVQELAAAVAGLVILANPLFLLLTVACLVIVWSLAWVGVLGFLVFLF
jgi:hypothetical protein